MADTAPDAPTVDAAKDAAPSLGFSIGLVECDDPTAVAYTEHLKVKVKNSDVDDDANSYGNYVDPGIDNGEICEDDGRYR